MSNIVILHSFNRNRKISPNPNSFEIDPKLFVGGKIYQRQTSQIQLNPHFKQDEFLVSINLHYIIIPYIENVTDCQPMLYLTLRNKNETDELLFTTNTKCMKSTFPIMVDKILTNDAGDKKFIYYKTPLTQVMKFKRDGIIFIRLQKPNGDDLVITGDNNEMIPFNEDLQTTVVFEVKSFVNDNTFSNHFVNPIPI